MKKCPNCGNDIICELQLNEKNNTSYLHEYCEKCGYDKPLDDFNQKYRGRMSEFFQKVSKKVTDKFKEDDDRK